MEFFFQALLFIAAIIVAGIVSFIFFYIVAFTLFRNSNELVSFLLSIVLFLFLSYFLVNTFWSFYTGPSVVADRLIFAGKIVNPRTARWNNNRLVLVYEREIEIGRAVSYRGEFPESNLGIIDGLFVVEIPNVYRFTYNDFKANKVPFQNDIVKRDKYTGIYHWFPEFKEGSWEVIMMRSKNLYYVIKVLDGPIETLPPEILSGKTRFDGQRIVVLPTQEVPANLSVEGDYIVQQVRPKVGLESVVVNNMTVPLNNCKSDQELVTPYSYTHTYLHKYTEEQGISGGLQVTLPILTWLKIVSELQTKYGFEDNEIAETKLIYNFSAAPRTYQYYAITWTEVWEKGIAYVVQDSRSLEVPFRVKTNVEYKITAETRPCP